MENEQKQGKERVDSEILFSKTVKAGKRIYYIDVKKDRKGELYLSLTESKRLKEQGDATHPVFENIRYSFIVRTSTNSSLHLAKLPTMHRVMHRSRVMPMTGADHCKKIIQL